MSKCKMIENIVENCRFVKKSLMYTLKPIVRPYYLFMLYCNSSQMKIYLFISIVCVILKWTLSVCVKRTSFLNIIYDLCLAYIAGIIVFIVTSYDKFEIIDARRLSFDNQKALKAIAKSLKGIEATREYNNNQFYKYKVRINDKLSIGIINIDYFRKQCAKDIFKSINIFKSSVEIWKLNEIFNKIEKNKEIRKLCNYNGFEHYDNSIIDVSKIEKVLQQYIENYISSDFEFQIAYLNEDNVKNNITVPDHSGMHMISLYSKCQNDNKTMGLRISDGKMITNGEPVQLFSFTPGKIKGTYAIFNSICSQYIVWNRNNPKDDNTYLSQCDMGCYYWFEFDGEKVSIKNDFNNYLFSNEDGLLIFVNEKKYATKFYIVSIL